jgi:Fe-S cluster biosynthesis and repair protein YggX
MALADDTPRRTVFCAKLKRELPGLDAPPWPGPLGQRIYEHISEEAWEMWEERMKMVLNEYRLLPFQKEAQALIATQMEEFLFGEDATPPPGFIQKV